MTRKEREELIEEFREAKALVQQLNRLTQRIETAADRAIEAYSNQGAEDDSIK